jgi:hypothetical protein
MRFLTAVSFHFGHALRTHPWMRLLLGAALVLAGILSVLLGIGHGGLIAAGSFVLAGAVTAIRRRPVRNPGNPAAREPLADAEDPQP